MVYVENRPWGSFELFILNKKCSVKILNVKKNKRLSLQYHKKRMENWKVIEGTGTIQIGSKSYKYKKNDLFKVPRGAKHRISATTDTKILEIAEGTFIEKDVIRIEDDFGRV